MNVAAFYILAALIVVTAAGAVLLPKVDAAIASLGALSLIVALLCVLSGAVLLGILEFIIPVGSGAGIWYALRRAGRLGLLGEDRLPRRGWWGAAAAAAGFGLLVIVVVIASGSAWHSGGNGGLRLVTALHYWAPYALAIAVAVAVTAVAAALMLGRVSDDERELDRVTLERRQREELTQRRREAREAARRSRSAAGERTG